MSNKVEFYFVLKEINKFSKDKKVIIQAIMLIKSFVFK